SVLEHLPPLPFALRSVGGVLAVVGPDLVHWRCQVLAAPKARFNPRLAWEAIKTVRPRDCKVMFPAIAARFPAVPHALGRNSKNAAHPAKSIKRRWAMECLAPPPPSSVSSSPPCRRTITAGRINRFGPPNVVHPEEVPKPAPAASIDACDLPSSGLRLGRCRET